MSLLLACDGVFIVRNINNERMNCRRR